MKNMCITIFMIVNILLFAGGDKEIQKEEKIFLVIITEKNKIKVGDELKITFRIINNTKITYGFNKSFLSVNSSVHFYDDKNNEMPLSTESIIDPIIKSIKNNMFLLKPGRKKSFTVKYKLEQRDIIKNLKLLEYHKLPKDSDEIYAKIIFYNTVDDIRIGKDKLGYNMYPGTLRSEKIKIIIED